jgi:signal transduction histidine kinase
MQFNNYSVFLLICGVAALIISTLIFRKVSNTVRSYGLLTLGVAIWSIFYSFELSSSSLEQILFFLKLEYIGISLLPALWIIFVLKFVGREALLNKKNTFLIFLPGIITLIGVWTNEYHHLHYISFGVDYTNQFPLFEFKPGLLYIFHTVYFYTLLFVGLLIQLIKFINADSVYRRQNVIIVLGTLIPMIFNITYLMGYRPMEHLDLTPYAFILTTMLIGIGLIRFKLFDIIPIARDKVIEVMQDGVLVLDTQNRIIDLNTKMKQIINENYSKAINLGDSFEQYFHSEAILIQLIKNQKNSEYEWSVNQKTFDIKLSPLLENGISFNGVILLFSEVSDRKAVENKLMQQTEELLITNELKNKLFSIVSHDLRNPILSLNEIVNLFNEGVITDDDIKSYMPLISKNIKNTSALLENLLHWSRSQLKGERIQKNNFNLRIAALLQVSILESLANEKNIKIENTIDETQVVYADRDMIELVFRNLISNAIKYCNNGGNISITSIIEEQEIQVCVKDTGIGIAEENLQKLFGLNNFSTLGTNKELGTGLGLLLCREFVHKNGGEIWVESKLNEGSKFCFTIPIGS